MPKKRIPTLEFEQTAGSGNLLFLSLVEYKREEFLCVIDTVDDESINAYVLDYAEQNGIKISSFLSLVTRWFYASSDRCPLSFEAAKYNLTEALAPMYKTLELSYVSRVVGNSFSFSDEKPSKVKRRRVIAPSEGIEIRFKKVPA